MHAPTAFNAWPTHGTPTDLTEEAFADELERTPRVHARHPAPDRNAYTAVIGALRAACTLAEMREIAPGLNPAQLLHAYQFLKARFVESVAAWNSIVNPETAERWHVFVPAAAAILPAPTRRVTYAHLWLSEPARRVRIAAIAQKVHDRTVLFGEHGPGTDPYVMPKRLAQATPSQVSALLREAE